MIAAELGPEQVGVGALQVLEYAQCPLPGVPGPGPVAGCVAGIAEMVECLGLAVALAELAEDTEGAVVAGCRFGVLPEVVVGAAEAVPAVCLAEPFAELLAQGQGRRPGGAAVA